MTPSSALEDLVAEDPDAPETTRVAIALSRCYRESGDFSRAIETGQRCLDSLQALHLDGSDDAIQLAVTVAAAHFTRGDVAHAVRLCRPRDRSGRAAGHAGRMASAYWNASIMESERGDSRAAVVLAERALQLLDSAESNRNLGRLRNELGVFQLRLDPPDIEGALANLEAAAQQLDWSSASPIDRGRNALALAKAKLMTGSPAEAYDDAEAVLTELRDTAPLLAISALIVMGQASFERGDGDARGRPLPRRRGGAQRDRVRPSGCRVLVRARGDARRAGARVRGARRLPQRCGVDGARVPLRRRATAEAVLDLANSVDQCLLDEATIET